MEHAPLRIRGKRNLLFLLAIVAVIAASGNGLGPRGPALAVRDRGARDARDRRHRVVADASRAPRREQLQLRSDRRGRGAVCGHLRHDDPCAAALERARAGLGLREPWQFFWASGLLSSFLDNAPTYLTFAATACGVAGVPLDGRYLADFLALGPQSAAILSAIATGSVFMGANSYIGNGPTSW